MYSKNSIASKPRKSINSLSEFLLRNVLVMVSLNACREINGEYFSQLFIQLVLVFCLVKFSSDYKWIRFFISIFQRRIDSSTKNYRHFDQCFLKFFHNMKCFTIRLPCIFVVEFQAEQIICYFNFTSNSIIICQFGSTSTKLLSNYHNYLEYI